MPGENGGARRSPSSGPTQPSAPAPRPASAWAPLRLPGVPGAVDRAVRVQRGHLDADRRRAMAADRPSPLLVSLVQTASSLPIVVLALPAGAWADLVDRRRLLLGAQLAMFLAAAALAVTTFLDAASPALILALTFALGCGNAIAGPAWQAIQPDLVDRSFCRRPRR